MAVPIVGNDDSILVQVKKILGMNEAYTAFDIDITLHINTVLSNLTQMGVIKESGFMVTGVDEKWSDLGLTSIIKTQQIKSYIPLKVRMMFDPPTNANVKKAIDESIEEIEFRLFVEEENNRYDSLIVSEEEESS